MKMNSTNPPSYKMLSILGKGAFGYVIEAYDRVLDQRVAIKRTHKVGQKLSREIQILKKINDCPYAVKLLGTFYSVNNAGKINQNLVFEYLNKSLNSYIKEKKKHNLRIPSIDIKSIVHSLLCGLDFIHKRNVVHRDLKPDNILMNSAEDVKLCDFGSAKVILKGTHSTPYMVSRFYRAPELLFGMVEYNSKIDIFSLGCIFAELFLLSPLFQGETEGMQIFEHKKVLGPPEKEYLNSFSIVDKKAKDEILKEEKDSQINLRKLMNFDNFYSDDYMDDVMDLIFKMLDWDPDKRISAEDALKHKFFDDLKK